MKTEVKYENEVTVVAVDGSGQFYFDNQVNQEQQLKEKLRAAVRESSGPLTLIVAADRAARYEVILRLGVLAREAGFQETLLATRPKLLTTPGLPAPTP